MARDFDAVDDMVTTDTPPVIASPFTVSVWFYPLDDTISKTFWGIGDKDTFNQQYMMQSFGTGAGDPLRFMSRNGGSLQTIDTTTGWTANAWNHACAMERSTTDRSVYVNGGGKTSGSTNVPAPTGVDQMVIGKAIEAANRDTWSGRLAEFAIWDIGLTDDEVAALAKGVSPLLIRPTSLVIYWPIIGNESSEIDLIGGNNGTLTGTTKVDHPRVYRASPPPVVRTADPLMIPLRLVRSNLKTA